MHIPFSVLLALVLSLDTLAAPVPNSNAGDVALEARAKVAVKKPATVKAPVTKSAAVKAKPAAVPAKKPVAAAPAKAPVAKPAAVPPKAPAVVPAKKPVAAAPAKAPVAAAPAKAPAALKPATGKTTKPGAVPAPAKAPVAAAPAKAPVVNPATGKTTKPGAVPATAPIAAAPAKAPVAPPKAPTAPAKLPTCTGAQIEERELEELEARIGGVTHPDATGTITLFHGTTPASGAALAAGHVDLSLTRDIGDFNHRPEVAGGFYMSDSLTAAAQFACFGIPGKRPASAAVVQYRWTGAGKQVFTFPGQTADWQAFQEFNNNANEDVITTGFRPKAAQLFQNDMIVGPLNGPFDTHLSNDFQQYAVIKQATENTNLVFQQAHQNILCKNIPTGNAFTARMYQQGQAGNAKFNTRLAKLQNPNFQPGNGKCVIA
ncbi:hypothetical protein B0H19DRAFT_1094975 [Mycena capillaripes]|nr:hypothetical protein B0H19DRAFT_1094975 [Mycena capillaripes]